MAGGWGNRCAATAPTTICSSKASTPFSRCLWWMPSGHSLALPFYRSLESRPDHVALQVEGAGYSYANLGRHAQGIADWITKQAPQGAQRVAILGGRSYESYAGLLGIC